MQAVSKEALSLWRVPYVVALVVAVAFALLYSGYLEVEIKLRTYPENKPYEANLKWGEEFDFWDNVAEWAFRSDRGEKFLVMIMLNFVFNWGLHLVCREVWKKALNPEDYYAISVRDRFFLAQKIPSSLHSLVVGIVSVKLLFWDQMFEDDIIDAYNWQVDWLVAYSFAYEMYDYLVMYVQTGAETIMYIHHLSLMVAYFLSVTHKKLAFVVVTMLITELTVIPNNLHWYLKVFKKSLTPVFHYNYALRLWSFIALRLTAPPYVFYMIWLHLDHFSAQHWIARYAVYIIVTLLAMMNVYWTRTLIYLYKNSTTLAQKLEKAKRKADEKAVGKSQENDKKKKKK